MKVHSSNSFAVLSVRPLTAWVVKFLSPETRLNLAHSSAGRVVLHVLCFWRDHRFFWHWQGIRRELSSTITEITKHFRTRTKITCENYNAALPTDRPMQ